MVERRGIEPVEHGGGGADDIAVEHHRDTLRPRREDGAGHGGDLPAAEPAQDLQGIAPMGRVQGDGLGHGGGLAGEAGIVDAGAAAHPVRRLAAIERVVDRRRDGGVADSHFADDEEIGAAGDRLHAEGHGGGAGCLVHGRALRDVAGRDVEGEIEDLQPDVEGGTELVDRGAAGREVRQHLARHLGRVGRDSLRDDAMIGSKHRDERPVQRRLALVLHGGEPFDDRLEPAQAAWRLGQLPVAGPDRLDRRLVEGRHQGHEPANIVEG